LYLFVEETDGLKGKPQRPVIQPAAMTSILSLSEKSCYMVDFAKQHFPENHIQKGIQPLLHLSLCTSGIWNPSVSIQQLSKLRLMLSSLERTHGIFCCRNDALAANGP